MMIMIKSTFVIIFLLVGGFRLTEKLKRVTWNHFGWVWVWGYL